MNDPYKQPKPTEVKRLIHAYVSSDPVLEKAALKLQSIKGIGVVNAALILRQVGREMNRLEARRHKKRQ